MRIAVTYDNGNIFQHFLGKTENFKVYEVENNQVISSEVISSNGSGHGALAGFAGRTECRCADLWWYWRRCTGGSHRGWD